jgi:hypothetical protein
MRNKTQKYVGKKGGCDGSKSQKYVVKMDELLLKFRYTQCVIDEIDEDFKKKIISASELVEYFFDTFKSLIGHYHTDANLIYKICKYCNDTLGVNICNRFMVKYEIDSIKIMHYDKYQLVCNIIDMSKKKVPNGWYLENIKSIDLSIKGLIVAVEDLRSKNMISRVGLSIVLQMLYKKIHHDVSYFDTIRAIEDIIKFCDDNKLHYEYERFWRLLFAMHKNTPPPHYIPNKLKIDTKCVEYIYYQSVKYNFIQIINKCSDMFFKTVQHKKVTTIDMDKLIIFLCRTDAEDSVIDNLSYLKGDIQYQEDDDHIEINVIDKIVKRIIEFEQHTRIYLVLWYILRCKYYQKFAKRDVINKIVFYGIINKYDEFLLCVMNIISSGWDEGDIVFDMTSIINGPIDNHLIANCDGEILSLEAFHKCSKIYECVKFNANEINIEGIANISKYGLYGDIMFWYDHSLNYNETNFHYIASYCLVNAAAAKNFDTFDAIVTLLDECDKNIHFAQYHTGSIQSLSVISELAERLHPPYQRRETPDDVLCPMCLNIPYGVTCAPCDYGHIYCLDCLVNMYKNQYYAIKCIACHQ